MKLIVLSIGKLSDDVDKLKEMVKDLTTQLTELKNQKCMPAVTNEKLKQQSEVEFITLIEVMKILKMSRNSVLGLIRNGIIREIRFTNRSIRYNKNEVLALAQPKA
ncbi:MAG: helix-turn-helix domain-containing protein [Bacteroidota bacterium]